MASRAATQLDAAKLAVPPAGLPETAESFLMPAAASASSET